MTVVLGKVLSQKDPEGRDTYIKAIPRFTYRKDFIPLRNGCNSDRNWGCCIRCGQSLLYQFLLRYVKTLPDGGVSLFSLKCGNLLELFYDIPDAPFGIHSICNKFVKLGGKIGEWVKTSTMALIIKELLKKFKIQTVIAENGTLSKEQLALSFQNKQPILLLFPLMLGPEQIDLTFLPFVQASLSIYPRSVGVVAGEQGKAYYLVGHCKSDILYFDPHETASAVVGPTSANSLFAPHLKTMNASLLNSSLVIGFFLESESDAYDLTQICGPQNACPIQIVDKIESVNDLGEEDSWDIVLN